MPILDRIDSKSLVIADILIDELSQVLAVLQGEQMVLKVGFARIDKINLLGEFLGEIGLSSTEISLHSDDQTVLAEFSKRRVGHLAPQAVVLLLVVPRLVVSLSDLIDREVSSSCHRWTCTSQ